LRKTKGVPREKTVAKYRTLFNEVADKKNWKYPTNAKYVASKKKANEYAKAINFFVGGSEIKKVKPRIYVVWSAGYYHYIGA